MTNSTRKDPKGKYRIGTVSRLTGITAETLRAWERRHKVIEPLRSNGGTRLYTDKDVQRLLLIKKLVDLRHAIGTIAHQSTESLREMLAMHQATMAEHPNAEATGSGSGHQVRVAVVGSALGVTLELGLQGRSRINLVATAQDAASLKLNADDVDLLLCDLRSLGDKPVEALSALRERLTPSTTMVVHTFARRDVLEQLTRLGCELRSGPLRPAELVSAIRPYQRRQPNLSLSNGAPMLPDDYDTTPRFDREALARLQQADSSIGCECPHHVSTLVRMLRDFEDYCERCETRSEGDIQLHRTVQHHTTTARVVMEHALGILAEADNLDV